MFLQKDFLKICSKFSGEHPRGIKISIEFQSNFNEITLPYGCSLNSPHIFVTPLYKNTSGGMLLIKTEKIEVIENNLVFNQQNQTEQKQKQKNVTL